VEPERQKIVIVEHAILDVIEGKSEAFETALAKAVALISQTPGFISLEVLRCIERAGRYLLLVKWRSIEDHTIGFRQSERYQEWRKLLHHFYSPFPEVLHFKSAVIVG
jgi:heme-degrading monooxygenase HmoA